MNLKKWTFPDQLCNRKGGGGDLLKEIIEKYPEIIVANIHACQKQEQDREDLFHNFSLRILEQHKTIERAFAKKTCNRGAYVITIIQNCNHDITKNKKKAKRFFEGYFRKKLKLEEGVLPKIDNKLARKDFLKILKAALSKKQYAVMYLYYFGGYSQKEIQKELDLSQAVVNNTISRSKKKIKKYLIKNGDVFNN